MLSFYMLFLILSFLIHPHKLFSMQLGPSTISLAYARLIVPFTSFTIYVYSESEQVSCIIDQQTHSPGIMNFSFRESRVK